MRFSILLFLTFNLLFIASYSYSKTALTGKNIFYNTKGKYGSCNYCHRNGNSAGRINLETGKIDPEEGRKIPSLKGIGERKDGEQIERSIKLMKKMFGFKLTDEQISQLVEYLGSL